MNETEWHRGNNVDDMLTLVHELPNRKQRLFCVACCRRLAHRTNEAELVRGIRAAERFADDTSAADEVDELYNVANQAAIGGDGLARAVREALTAVIEPILCADDCCLERWREAVEVEQVELLEGDIWDRVSENERIAQAALVRDIFGNPFRPVAFDPAWRTSDAVALARAMYDSRDFGAMPILADALQDAGCEDEQVLTHCRDANHVHVRGCWVCDLVLGLL